MVQSNLDKRVLKLLEPSHSFRITDQILTAHAAQTAYILVGAYGGKPEIRDDLSIHLTERYNSAFLYRPDASAGDRQYNKIHIVPFGEVVPFKKNAPWLHKILMSFTPYDYDYSLDYGTEYTVFEMTADNQTYRFGVMICYEDVVAAIARNFTLADNGRKNVDWLLNISNDGWFVRFQDQKVLPSTELPQHTAICVFRAVENRVAILRSVNTGISCLIDTVGRIKNGFSAGNLPITAMERKGMAGWFADIVPIDQRITFFTSHGQWLDLLCRVAFGLCIVAAVAQKLVRKKN